MSAWPNFLGSQKELGSALLRGEVVEGKLVCDRDLGVVLLAHPLDYWEGPRLGQRLEDGLASLFAPLGLHLLPLEEENAHVRYAAGVLWPRPSTKNLPVSTAARP